MKAASFLRVYASSDRPIGAKLEALGWIATLAARSPSHRGLPVRYLGEVVVPAIENECSRLFFNEDGEVVAFVAWAYLDARTVARVMSTGRLELHASEWVEGEHLWIVDFLAPFGNLPYVMRALRDEVFADEQQVSYLRPKRGQVLAKSLSRADKATFFRGGGERSPEPVMGR